MNKKFFIMIKKVILSLIILTLFNVYKVSYSFANESTIDLLIENKQRQKELQIEINNINNKIELKKEGYKNSYIDLDKNNSVDIVKISFVKSNNQVDIENNEIDDLEEAKNILSKELEETIIEGVKIEKILEQYSLEELENNNKDFIIGIWPLKEYTYISSQYGYRIHPISNVRSFHKGIDIPAPQDTDIVSIDDGIVTFSGYQNGYGNVIKIKHFDGKISIYAHNNSLIVSEDDVVKQGDIIAKVGSTGNSTGNHVHFEIIVNNKNINPIYGVIK